MKQYMWRFVTVALLVSAAATAAMAQAQTKALTPIKVQVVISRFEGDKKVSSLPYTLALTANERGVSLRMGSQVPVPSATGFSYQSVGTNIDCTATSTDDGRFKVRVSISDSSVMERRTPDSPPTLRNFNTDNEVVLKDGQSAQYTAAADKTTGEVVKVDVTLTVEK